MQWFQSNKKYPNFGFIARIPEERCTQRISDSAKNVKYLTEINIESILVFKFSSRYPKLKRKKDMNHIINHKAMMGAGFVTAIGLVVIAKLFFPVLLAPVLGFSMTIVMIVAVSYRPRGAVNFYFAHKTY